VNNQQPDELRIAFAGSSGTGKSTLLNAVNASFKLPALAVQTRDVARQMGFASPYDVDAAGKRCEFQELLLDSKVTAEKFTKSFITDRTVVDVLTYYALHESRHVTSEIIKKARSAYARYTHVFLCPMDTFFEPGDDPARLGASFRGYHETFEELCFSWIHSFANATHMGGPLIWSLEDSSLEKRIENVVQVVTENG
jgi:predicted ATPase